MNKYNGHLYKWSKPFGYVHHWWEVRSEYGGVHFHVTIVPDAAMGPSAGLEFHRIVGSGAPDHINCFLTGGRCWHDGTSMYATDNLWPEIKRYLEAGNHEAVFRLLEHEAERLAPESSTAPQTGGVEV